MLVAFGKYLRLVRERRKLSLTDVVTLTKSYPEPIGKRYLSRVERGLARVGFSKMVALSRAYEVSLDAFGEKLALDLEVDELKDAPDTKGKTFGELADLGKALGQKGFRWMCYAAMRDALHRAASDPVHTAFRDREEQIVWSALSHGVSAQSLGRYALAFVEFTFVRANEAALSPDRLPVIYQLLAVAKRLRGELRGAMELATRAIELAERSPTRHYLGDAIGTKALIANQSGDHALAVSTYQEAFAAYKAADRRIDCARTLNNLAQAYFDMKRYGAARRSLGAADRLATELSADAIRVRSRILMGEIELIEGDPAKASQAWHDALEIARKTHDTVAYFKAEFQLFNLAIQQKNVTVTQALARRLNRLMPWIPRTEPEVEDFIRLYAIHRKPKQRTVAAAQHDRPASRNPDSRRSL